MAAARKQSRKEAKVKDRLRSLMARLAALAPEQEKSSPPRKGFKFWRVGTSRST
jgi:hypothetical protein